MENGSTSSLRTPHFFKPLLPGFLSHINIPIAFFSKHLKGIKNEGSVVVKLISDASDIIWEVKMDGQRLSHGWQKFATSHDLRVGDIVIFRHEGDLLFHVTPFGPSCCEIQYDAVDGDGDGDSDRDGDGDGDGDGDSDGDADSDGDGVMQISSDSDSEKYKHTREAGSSSDHSCFVASVTVANLSKDMLFLPMKFSRTNGLMNRKCEIILQNEGGKPWRLLLDYHKTRGRVYIKGGWKRFCCENRRRANDFLTFKLVQTGTTPVIQLCSSHRFLTLTLTPYTLKAFKLCLPATFMKANGIEKARKITLVDRCGVKRTTSLKPEDKYGRMRLGKEWIEFCEVNGVKAGESFKLELIKEEEDAATHLLKFCSKILNPL